jgi:putative membrane protein
VTPSTLRTRWPAALALVAGLAAAAWTVAHVGLGDLARAAVRLGPWGFLLLCLVNIGVLAVLGAAWLAANRQPRLDRLPLYTWARAAREASSDLLPFAQLGGLVVGARTLTAAGVPATRVYAAMIVDLTTEMAGQLVVVLFGLWALGSMMLHGGAVSNAAWAGAGSAVAVLAGFVLLQRPLLALADRMANRLIPGRLPLAAIRTELDRLYAARVPVARSFMLNLAAWLLTAASAWLAFQLMAAPVPFWRAVALESLISVVRSAAFVVPGALGVQEAGYLVLAHALGIAPEAAVALSLVKRARDLAIGLPTLLAWQANEWLARAPG